MSSLRASFSTKQLRRAAKNWLLKQPGHEVVGLFLVKCCCIAAIVCARTRGLRCRKYHAAPTRSCGMELATPGSTIAALRLARDAGRGAVSGSCRRGGSCPHACSPRNLMGVARRAAGGICKPGMLLARLTSPYIRRYTALRRLEFGAIFIVHGFHADVAQLAEQAPCKR